MQTNFLFGTVGSPISTPAKPGGSVGAIQQMASLGLGTLELGWVQSVRVSEETCRAIKKTANEHQIAISVHAPYFINLNADEEEWPKSRKRLMDAAFFGNLAGATDIIFHPGSYFGAPPDGVVAVAIERLKHCVEELAAQGNPVRLRPETMGKAAMLGSLQDTLSMSAALNQVLPCVDFAHLHARPGDGSANSATEWQQMIDGYAQAIGKDSLQSMHIHLSGIEYSEKGERNHLPLRESDLKIQDLLKVLHDNGCGGRILCESPAMEEDALYMQEIWNGLA
jgi:deoxyribonuclease IV